MRIYEGPIDPYSTKPEPPDMPLSYWEKYGPQHGTTTPGGTPIHDRRTPTPGLGAHVRQGTKKQPKVIATRSIPTGSTTGPPPLPSEGAGWQWKKSPTAIKARLRLRTGK